jgi:hypothetical protein
MATRASQKGAPDSRFEQAEGPIARALTPPPTQFHRPPRQPVHRPHQAPEGPEQGQCTHVKAKTPSDEADAVPEVGLELHSSTCKHWTPSETCGIQPDPTHIRPSPKPKLWTMYTRQIGQIRAARPHCPSQGGCSVFCARSLPERNSGQTQHQAPSAVADRRSFISAFEVLG